jgi:hypothetical protein
MYSLTSWIIWSLSLLTVLLNGVPVRLFIVGCPQKMKKQKVVRFVVNFIDDQFGLQSNVKGQKY